MIHSVFSGPVLPPCAPLHLWSLWNQAADTSQKNLEKELAAFLSMLKNESLPESKTFITIIVVSYLRNAWNPVDMNHSRVQIISIIKQI